MYSIWTFWHFAHTNFSVFEFLALARARSRTHPSIRTFMHIISNLKSIYFDSRESIYVFVQNIFLLFNRFNRYFDVFYFHFSFGQISYNLIRVKRNIIFSHKHIAFFECVGRHHLAAVVWITLFEQWKMLGVTKDELRS